MKPKVLFNCVPPALITMPSASFSVLSNFLAEHQVSNSIYYWNLRLFDLQKKFLWIEGDAILQEEIDSILLFFNYLAIKMQDQSSYNKIKGRLMTIKPQFVGREIDLFDKHMYSFAERLDRIIDDVISEVCSPDILYYGFSANLYQWIASSIIAKKIKDKYPNCIILLGGLGNKSSAIKFLENFKQFDFALWGEAENSLYTLICEFGNEIKSFENISNLAYRKQDEIVLSVNRKVNFADLSSMLVRPNYLEYFEQIKTYCSEVIVKGCSIPVEGSRGCHWNKCHFCYLNVGYQNRVKSVEQLVDEIKFHMDSFHVYAICFLDNDIINNDYTRFNTLLDRLIELKLEYPSFLVRLAEIITKDVNQDVIKKMALAGFEHVQIGYESPSNNLLKKIEKKNSFASNFLFIKFASKYKIRIGGANVLRGLFEETEDDIMESITNLHVLRFVLRNNYFQHNISMLAVNKSSRYYKQYPEVKKWEKMRFFTDYLPKEYLLASDDELDVIEAGCPNVNSLWDVFQYIEAYYLKSHFTNQLFSYENTILYKECFNETVINELAFEQDSLEWYILRKVNSIVVSFDELCADVKNNFTNITNEEIIGIIEDLKEEKLIYTSEDYLEIVAIIDVDLLV